MYLRSRDSENQGACWSRTPASPWLASLLVYSPVAALRADSGPCRPPIPGEADHGFRSMPTTRSGDAVRPFRQMPSTRSEGG